jgi:hypothetical protein
VPIQVFLPIYEGFPGCSAAKLSVLLISRDASLSHKQVYRIDEPNIGRLVPDFSSSCGRFFGDVDAAEWVISYLSLLESSS